MSKQRLRDNSVTGYQATKPLHKPIWFRFPAPRKDGQASRDRQKQTRKKKETPRSRDSVDGLGRSSDSATWSYSLACPANLRNSFSYASVTASQE
jgi:hypothetical protein